MLDSMRYLEGTDTETEAEERENVEEYLDQRAREDYIPSLDFPYNGGFQ